MIVAKSRGYLFLLKGLQHVRHHLFPPRQLLAMPLTWIERTATPGGVGRILALAWLTIGRIDLGRGVFSLYRSM